MPEHHIRRTRARPRALTTHHEVIGPVADDAERHIARIKEYVQTGFDHVYVHQVGPDQEGFFRFYERSVMPEFGSSNQRSTRREVA
jgi:hypothetical protein